MIPSLRMILGLWYRPLEFILIFSGRLVLKITVFSALASQMNMGFDQQRLVRMACFSPVGFGV